MDWSGYTIRRRSVAGQAAVGGRIMIPANPQRLWFYLAASPGAFEQIWIGDLPIPVAITSLFVPVGCAFIGSISNTSVVQMHYKDWGAVVQQNVIGSGGNNTTSGYSEAIVTNPECFQKDGYGTQRMQGYRIMGANSLTASGLVRDVFPENPMRTRLGWAWIANGTGRVDIIKNGTVYPFSYPRASTPEAVADSDFADLITGSVRLTNTSIVSPNPISFIESYWQY